MERQETIRFRISKTNSSKPSLKTKEWVEAISEVVIVEVKVEVGVEEEAGVETPDTEVEDKVGLVKEIQSNVSMHQNRVAAIRRTANTITRQIHIIQTSKFQGNKLV